MNAGAEHSSDAGESRLTDLEFKLAFVERELETWKEAVDELHERLARTEDSLRKALRELRGESPVTPDKPYEGSGSGSEMSS